MHRYYKDRKVMKDMSEFFPYLLDRLVRLHDGIHNLKIVGTNLRLVDGIVLTSVTELSLLQGQSDNCSLSDGTLYRKSAGQSENISYKTLDYFH